MRVAQIADVRKRSCQFICWLVVCWLCSFSVWAQSASVVEPQIATTAQRYNLDPRLLWVIAYLESRFNPRAVSPKGARGLMQLMPATAARYGVTNPHDVAQALNGAARYLRDLMARYPQRLDLVLAAYNAGEGTVDAYLYGEALQAGSRLINAQREKTNGLPPYRETRAYVQRGLTMLGLAPPTKSKRKVDEVMEVEATNEPRGLVRQSVSLMVTEPSASNLKKSARRSLYFTNTSEMPLPIE